MKTGTLALTYSLILTVTLLCGLPSNGRAMLAPAQGAASNERAADMKTIQTVLESKIVRERLKGLGLTDKEIDSRLGNLSDQQIHKLAKDIDQLAPGGLIGELLVLIILVLLIVFLIHRV
jgi:hypothetical protein